MDSSGWDSRFAANPHHFGAGPNTLLEKYAADLHPGTAADVGCGQGRNTAWLASRGWHVTAVDYSPVGLAHTREATAAALAATTATIGAEAAETGAATADADAVAVDDRLTTVLSDVKDWEPGTAFDLVVAAYLHMPSADMRVLWRRLADATVPGGTLVVVGHDSDNAGGGPKDPDVLFHAADVTTVLPDGWDVTVAEAVDRGEGSIDALVVARKSG